MAILLSRGYNNGHWLTVYTPPSCDYCESGILPNSSFLVESIYKVDIFANFFSQYLL
jgi:hypothetical protein